MSTTVDERVVEMTFDNKQFEKNVKESMSTIDKLKEKLNFKGMKDGLDDFQESASKFDLDEMEKAADSVSIKFSALEAIGLRVIQRITDAAFDAGVSMVKSLSVDNIAAGWSKYEAKTANVQTIMNSTGKSIDEVNQYLSKLMWFSDETSFSFSDMTTALATMTASGADIDTIIPTIMGIAEATAYAGKTSSEFGRVIYNLTQSYSQGYLNAMDWKSVALAGVNSKQLIESLIAAGEEVGTIEKGQVTVENFTGSLSDLKWANTKVMEKAFSKWSSMMTDAYELVNGDDAEFDTAAEAIKSLSGQYEQYIEDATVAAQSAKSFAEAIAATQDAVSSGWLKTFETIFGDYEEGKTLWSDITEEFWEIFAASRDERNDVLKAWKELGGRDLIFANTEESTGAFWTLYYSIKDITDAIGSGFREIFPKQTAEQLYQITENIKEFTEKLQLSEESLEKIQNISSKVFGVIKYTLSDIGSIINYIYKVLAKPIITKIFSMLPVIGNKFIVPIYRALNTLYGVIDGIVNDFGSQFKDIISDISGAAKGTISLSSIIEKIGKIIATIIGYTATLLYQIHESELVISIIKGIAKVITTIFDIIKALFDLISGKSKWSDFVSSFVEIGKNIVIGLGNGIKNTFNIITNIIKALANFVINIFKNLLGIHSPSTVFEGFGENIGEGLINGIKNISQAVFNAITWLVKKIISIVASIIDLISDLNVFDKIGSVFNTVINAIKNFGKAIGNAFTEITGKSVGQATKSFVQNLKDTFTKTKETVSNFADIDTGGVSKLGDKLAKVFSPIVSLGKGLVDVFKAIWEGFKWVWDLLSPLLSKLGELLSYIANSIINFVQGIEGSKFKDLLTTLLLGYAGFGVGEILDGIGKAFIGFGDFAKRIDKILKAFSYVLDSVSDVLYGFAFEMKAKGVAEVIKSIGKALLEIAAAIVIISIINTDKLESSAVVIITVLTELIGGILAAVYMTNTKSGSASISGIKTSVKDTLEKTALIRALGTALVKMALAILVIAAAMKLISGIPEDRVYSSFTLIALIVAGLASFIQAMANMPNINKVNFESITKSMKKIASMLLIIGIAMALISFMSWETYGKTMATLAGFIVIFTAFAFALTKLKIDETKLTKATASMVILAVALLILANVCLLMAIVPWTGMLKAGVMMAGFLIIFAGITYLFSKIKINASDMIKLMASMAIFAGILTILSVISMLMYLVSWKNMLKLGVLMAGTLLIFIGAMALFKLIAADTTSLIKAMAALAIFTGIITLLSAVSLLMTFVSWDTLGKLGALMGGVVIALAAVCVIALIPNIGAKLLSLSAGFVAFAGAVALLGVGVAALAIGLKILTDLSGSFIEPLTMALKALVNFIFDLAVALVEAFINSIKTFAEALPVLKDAIISIISTIISTVLTAISNTVDQIAETFLNLILTVITKLADYIGPIVSALFDVLINAALAMVEKLPELISILMDLIIQVLTLVAENLQNFSILDLAKIMVQIGEIEAILLELAVVFGTAWLLDATLSACAENLADFAIKIKPFLDAISGVDPGVIEAAKNLAETILIFTGSSILDAIGSFLGGSSIEEFGEQFAALGPYLSKFGESVKDVDVDTVQKAAIAAQSLASFASNIPREGGLLQSIIGEVDFKGFAEGLAEFGPAFAKYAESVKDIDKDTIENSSEAAMFVAKFAKEIPNSGGALAWLIGDNTLSDFGEQLTVFGPAFAEYAKLMVGIPTDTIKASSEAALTIANFAKEVPNSGGALAWLIGDNRLDDFGEQLKSFGPAFAEYAKLMVGIPTDTIKASSEAALTIAKFAKEVPNSDGALGWLIGDNRLDDFGEQLKSFGPNFADYAKNMKGVSNTIVKRASSAALTVAKFAKEIPNSGGALAWLVGDNRLDDFGAQLPKFGEGFAGFIKALNGVEIDFAKVTMCEMIASMMAALENNLPRTGGVVQWFIGQKDLGQFGTQLADFGTGMASYMKSISGADYDTEKVNASVEIALALSKINEKTSILSTLISWITGETALSQLGEGLIPLAEGMSEYMSSISNADFDEEKIIASVNAAVALSSINDHTDALSALVEWFTGDTAYEKLATSMPSLAEGIVEYGTAIKDAGFTLSDFIRIGKSADIVVALSKINDHKTALQTLAEWITGEDVYESLSEGMPKLAEGLVDYGNTIYKGNFDDTKLSNSADIISKLAGAYSTVTGGFDIFDWLISHKESDLQVFANNLPTLAKGITEYAKIIQTATVSVNAPDTISQAKIKNLGNTMQTYDEAYGIIVKSVSFDSKDIKASIEAINSLSGLANLSSFWDQLIDILGGDDIEEQMTKFSKGLSAVGQGITNMTYNMKGMFESFETGYSETGGEIVLRDDISRFALLVDTIVKIGNEIYRNGSYLTSGSLSFVNVTEFGAALNSFYSDVKDFSVSKITNIERVIAAITNALTKKDLGLSAADTLTNLYAIGKKLTNSLVLGMTGEESNTTISSALKSIITYMVNYWNGNANKSDYLNGVTPWTAMYNIGKNLVLGVSIGMEDPEVVDKLTGACKNIGEGTIRKFQDFYQIESPSKVMKGIGMYITEGLALGIVDTEGTSMLVGSIAKIVDMVENNVDAQPTIRPVMDLTEIQNGVKLANSVTAGLNGAYVTGSYNMASDTAYRANLRQAELNNASNVSVASEVGRILGEVVASNGTTFNNTFNITGDDPEEIAEEVSRIIQQDMERRNAVWA